MQTDSNMRVVSLTNLSNIFILDITVMLSFCYFVLQLCLLAVE